MSEPDPQTEVAVVVSFLERFLADRANDVTRTLEDYQACFPGFETAIAREYEAATEGSAGDHVRPEETNEVDPLGALRHEGEVSGRYERHEEIARGGMGRILRVWDRDLKRSLAMKVMADGASGSGSHASGSQAVQRFLLEAEVTGQLEHPGIVPVHDLGIGSDGRVYFTMSMVQGRNLQEIIRLVHSGDADWSTTRALDVILRVCEAVAFAHDKGVIHRDLKPSNVMVGPFGETYVMDWGLARRLDQRGEGTAADASATESASPLMTMVGDVIGTPAYMAPEQARGDAARVGKRSDVYAIGAMLYHLFAGAAPYATSAADASSETVLPLVKKGPPEPLHTIRPDVPGELVAICDKAMAREPDNRYSEVMALAEDLRAYLDTRVVRAYETGAWAELRKWVRRNKRFAVTCALGVVALVVGLAFALVQKERADRTALSLDAERHWTLKFAFDVLEELGTDLAENQLGELRGAQALRVRVLENTKKFYEDFLAARGKDPRALGEAAKAYGRLASIHHHLGSYKESRAAAEESIRLYRRLAAADPGDAAVRHELAKQYLTLASVLGAVSGTLPDAVPLMQRAASEVRAIVREVATDFEVRHTLAEILHNLSIVLHRLRRSSERDTTIREVLVLREQLVRDRPKDCRFRDRLAASYVAQVHYLTRTGRPEDAVQAEVLCSKAERLYLDLVETEDDDARYRVGLGELYTQRGILRGGQPDPERYQRAYDDHRRALQYREGLAQEFPDVPLYIGALGASLSNVGSQYLWTRRPEHARPYFERAIRETRKALALIPDHRIFRQYLRTQLGKLARSHYDAGQHAEAAALVPQLLEAFDDVPQGHLATARILGNCLKACRQDTGLSSAERAEHCEDYARRVLASLEKAREAGLAVDELTHKSFDGLRDRADFKRLEASFKSR